MQPHALFFAEPAPLAVPPDTLIGDQRMTFFYFPNLSTGFSQVVLLSDDFLLVK